MELISKSLKNFVERIHVLDKKTIDDKKIQTLKLICKYIGNFNISI